jgi:hypothetical protein
MKTQRKNRRPLNLKTRNKRWKWMAGATAATAAGVTASQASTITINLVNNYLSSGNSGNHLNADLTGDGHPDLTIANARYTTYTAAVALNGVQAFCRFRTSGSLSNQNLFGYEQLGSRFARFFFHRNFNSTIIFSSGTSSLMGSIPIFFQDLHINGGAPTRGSLEVTVNFFQIQLDSLTYNTRNNVPDQGSTLALLAMGAGGVLALRRWRGAQERS